MKPNCECCNGTAQIIPGGFQRIGKVAKVKPHWRRALEETLSEVLWQRTSDFT